MDAQSEIGFSSPLTEPLVVTGLGAVVVGSEPTARTVTELDLNPWLRSKKTRKFMGRQDQLAVIAAGQAAQAANLRNALLGNELLGRRTGIYACIGYIPFDSVDIEAIARNSQQQGDFSMARFSTTGYAEVNPLLTFRCLPNMPCFHISLNLAIQGPYFISYPDAGQFYLALDQAVAALQHGEIELALVGGVADQNNFLVLHHYQRFSCYQSRHFADAGGFFCLERRESAEKRGAQIRMELLSYQIEYQPPDPYDQNQQQSESLSINGDSLMIDQSGLLGAASLPVGLEWASRDYQGGEIVHQLTSLGGISATSRWRLA